MIPAAAVHAPSGFFATDGGYEYPALLGVCAAALALTGPGDCSQGLTPPLPSARTSLMRTRRTLFKRDPRQSVERTAGQTHA